MADTQVVTPELPVSSERLRSAIADAASFDLTTPVAITFDYLCIALGTLCGYLVYRAFQGAGVPNEGLKLLAFSFQYALAFVLFGRTQSLYSHAHSLLRIRETATILRVSVFSLALVAVSIVFGRILVPRLLLLLSWVLLTAMMLLQKHLVRRMLAGWKASRTVERRVLILGSGSDARRLFSFLLNSPDLRLCPVGFFEEQSTDEDRVIFTHSYRFKESAPVYGGKLQGELLDSLRVSDIFVADPNLSSQQLSEVASLAREHSTELSLIGSVQPLLTNSVAKVQEMDGLLVSSLKTEHVVRYGGYEITKRIFEFSVTALLLLITSPLWIMIAVWIKLTSEGPVFFQQRRIGCQGKPFGMYKFRSMYTTAPKYGRSPEDANDPRITKAGRFLRKTSLDELPQLLNVLLGDMALVGPRPEMPYVVARYDAHQQQRLSVAPGITGIWQLSADRKFAIHESIEYDLYYIEHRGFFLDLAILLHTAAFAMKGI